MWLFSIRKMCFNLYCMFIQLYAWEDLSAGFIF